MKVWHTYFLTRIYQLVCLDTVIDITNALTVLRRLAARRDWVGLQQVGHCGLRIVGAYSVDYDGELGKP